MRFQLGMLVCLLAGCVAQPTSSTPLSLANAGPPQNPSGPSGSGPSTPPLSLLLRIGIEHLPPDPSSPADEGSPVRVEAQQRFKAPRTSAPATPAEAAPAAWRGFEAAPRHTWQLSASDLAAIDDPVARETMRFVNDLIDQDRRRDRREAGMLFLPHEYLDPDRGPLLQSEETMLADHEEWVHARGPGLLTRPLKLLLRRLPFVQQFELDVKNFRSDNVPLTEDYRQAHGDRENLGRMSLRLHAGELDDPLEVGYVQSGVRVASSMEQGKVSIDWALTERLQFALRASHEYETGNENLRADLTYWVSPFTSLHLGIGEEMDFLSTSSIYSLYESQMDGSPGVVFYAVHIF
ncbi:MAG TPA: hypothetical protein VFD82_11280 [Planctomycetota bacterium]|nr:hypothetical protein [Planctomycetota bacterium]